MARKHEPNPELYEAVVAEPDDDAPRLAVLDLENNAIDDRGAR
jgi:hypothetical protein